MQGWQGRVVRYILFALLPLLLVGCEESSFTDPSDLTIHNKFIPLGELFNSSETGTIQGRITWEGPIPQVPPFRAITNPNFEPPWPREVFEKWYPNPNAPKIDPHGGVAGVVVFLRKVDLKKSRPWDHLPVMVSFQKDKLEVRQGKDISQTGFVRQRDAVTFASLEHRYHAIRGRQGDFFTLTLPEPNQPRSRQLCKKGVVELSSAADYYWLRGYLFVAEHPYYTRTNHRGEFILGQVPAGEYELVAWMPSWLEAEHHHNPENMCIHRFFFKFPVEQISKIHVKAEGVSAVSLSFRTDLFTGENTKGSVTSR